MEQPTLGIEEHLVVALDTLNEGVHFPVGTSPQDIGFKALAVNLSDLAAMGAKPSSAFYVISCGQHAAGWVTEVEESLILAGETYGLQTHGQRQMLESASVTVQILGTVPVDEALIRSGARVEDHVIVTGTLGDAGAGLTIAQSPQRPRGDLEMFLLDRLNRPSPRLDAGLACRGLAHSAVDISDGLLSDLGHILKASGVGAAIDVDRLPLSAQNLESSGAHRALQHALRGGDDYELCLTCAATHSNALCDRIRDSGGTATVIGRIEAGPGLRLQSKHFEIDSLLTSGMGWEHFS